MIPVGEIYGKIGLCPAFCRNCIYRSRQHNTCDYIVIEGHSRAKGQALPGEGCTVRVTGTRRAQPHVMPGQGSSPRTLPEPKPKPEPVQRKKPGLKPGTKRKVPEKKNLPKAETFPERLEMYHQGMTDAQIARAVGVKTSVIAQWRYRGNLPRVQSGRLLLPADQEKARMELYQKGLNDCQIGRELGVSDTTISMWRKARELPPNRPVNRLTQEQAALRTQMYEAGASDREIAEALGLNPNSVNAWRQSRKLKCNRKREK